MTSRLTDHRTSQRRFRFGLIWVGYWIFLFVIMHIPIKAPVSLPGGSDKLAHFMLYAILASLGGISLNSSCSHARRLRMLAVWAVVYAAYGAIDEYLQPYVGRTCSLADWVADVCGIVAGSVVIGLRPLQDRTEEP